MDLVQIDHVDTHSRERRFTCSPEVGRRRVVGEWRQDAAFGREHHAVAQPRCPGEHGAEDFLDLAEACATPVEAVDVRVVDEVHSSVQRCFEDSPSSGKIGVRVSPEPKRQRSDVGERSERARRRIDQSCHTANLPIRGVTRGGSNVLFCTRSCREKFWPRKEVLFAVTP